MGAIWTVFLSFPKRKKFPISPMKRCANFGYGSTASRFAAGSSETLKKKTQNYYLIALRIFSEISGAARHFMALQPDRIELAQTGERHLDLISSEELARFLGAPDGADLKSLRDRAMLEFFFHRDFAYPSCVPCRAIWIFPKGEFSVRGKREKVRVVFVSPEANAAVGAYLKKRADMDDAMFIQISKPRNKRSQKFRSGSRRARWSGS